MKVSCRDVGADVEAAMCGCAEDERGQRAAEARASQIPPRRAAAPRHTRMPRGALGQLTSSAHLGALTRQPRARGGPLVRRARRRRAPWGLVSEDRPRPRATARLSCCSKDGRRDAPPAGKDQEPPRQGATRCGQAPASAIHATCGSRSKAQVSELRRRRRTRGQAVRKGAELRRARNVHVGIRFARARTSGCEPASGRWQGRRQGWRQGWRQGRCWTRQGR